jgi:hypothetical protein
MADTKELKRRIAAHDAEFSDATQDGQKASGAQARDHELIHDLATLVDEQGKDLEDARADLAIIAAAKPPQALP